MADKIITVNCWVYDGQRMLLGMKKRGFAEGRWNGFGGKLLPGESKEAAAKRETEEECGITITNMVVVGVMDFEYQSKDKVMEVSIFKINSFTGEPRESEEMKPQWFDVDKLPYNQMWPDDQYWLPYFLRGEKFKGNFIYDGYDTILNYHLEKL